MGYFVSLLVSHFDTARTDGERVSPRWSPKIKKLLYSSDLEHRGTTPIHSPHNSQIIDCFSQSPPRSSIISLLPPLSLGCPSLRMHCIHFPPPPLVGGKRTNGPTSSPPLARGKCTNGPTSSWYDILRHRNYCVRMCAPKNLPTERTLYKFLKVC